MTQWMYVTARYNEQRQWQIEPSPDLDLYDDVTRGGVAAALNAFGRHGWELVTMFGDLRHPTWVFKQPLG